MGNNIVLKQKETGLIKEAKVGFSWTNLCFGILCPLVRGDWKWFAIQTASALITAGVSTLVFPFFYNKMYITDLMEKGYEAVDERSELLLRSKNII